PLNHHGPDPTIAASELADWGPHLAYSGFLFHCYSRAISGSCSGSRLKKGRLPLWKSLLDGSPMIDTTDLVACNRYRLAYGQAARLVEMSRFDHSYGRDFALGVEPDGIREEVVRQCPTFPPELVNLAVDDAMRGRRPRW